MCGRFALTLPPEAVRRHFDYLERPNFPPRYNIAPTQPIAIVRAEKGVRHFVLVRWGLIPSWVKDVQDFPLLINARAESAPTKPAFRAAMRYRRCLVPADGFYEWQKVVSGPKRPYLIRRRDKGPFAFAGLWEAWQDANGNELETTTILTTDANATLAPIHDRMPVILAREDYPDWLDTEGTSAGKSTRLLRPAPDDLLKAVEIGRAVNKVANDDASVQEPASAAGGR